MGAAGETKQQIAFEFVQGRRTEPERRHIRAVPGEIDQVEAAKGRRELILFAADDLHVVALDLVSQFGQDLIAQEQAQPLPEQSQHHHDHGGGGTEAGAGRGVALEQQGKTLRRDVQTIHHRLHQGQLRLARRAVMAAVADDGVVVQGLQPYFLAVVRLQGTVDIVVDRRAQDHAAALREIRFDIRAPAGETNAQRRAAPDDHKPLPLRLPDSHPAKSRLRVRRSSVPATLFPGTPQYTMSFWLTACRTVRIGHEYTRSAWDNVRSGLGGGHGTSSRGGRQVSGHLAGLSDRTAGGQGIWAADAGIPETR